MADSQNEQHPGSGAASWSEKNKALMNAGVTITDPANTTIDPDVEVGEDTVIYPGCTLRGRTRIGSHCEIGPHAVIIDSEIGDHAKVQTSARLEGVHLGNHVTVVPFQHLSAHQA